MKLELRANNVTLQTDGQLTVEGYVNKPGQLSEVLGNGTQQFRERIKPGAFKEAIESRNREIEFLAEHDTKLVLASTRNSSLELTENEQGLFMRAKITPTSYGKDYYTLISDKLISSMSFGFRAIKDSWTKMGDVAIRTVEKLELFEVSAVKNPAYTQSQIAARNIELIEEIEIPNLQNLKEERGNQMSEILRPMGTEGNTEVRTAVEQFGKELRELQVSTDNANIISENVANEIVLKMTEVSPVFAAARKFKTVVGNLTVPKETSTTNAGFVGEGNNVLEGSISFDEVKLTQKRVGAAMSLSNKLTNDALNIEEYTMDLLARRAAVAVEKSILTGNTEDEFRGIIHDTEINSISTKTITHDTLLEIYLSLNPQLLAGAQFISSRELFNQIAKLKDGNGHSYVQNGVVNGKLTYTLFGVPVHITEALPATTPFLFGNFTEAYGIMVKQEMSLQKVTGDTTQALRGSKLLVIDGYMDGAVINPQAVTKLVITD